MIINKVNRVWFKKSFLDNIRHSVTNAQIPVKIVYPLESKRLLQVKGNDAAVFLQGLITNDMRHFDEGANSIYAMFLNNRGRVLYDTLIHKWDDGESFLIECDKNIINSLSKHLKLFKLRRLIDIKDVTSSFKIWAMITPPNFVFDRVVDSRNSINLFKDPRLPDLGFRMLTPPTIEETEIADVIGDDIKIESKEDGYKYFRYKLGVSEGAEDLQPGSNFPLEVNCDYLHGVSFHKGCYIGQELTARVHHTGVVRKRIMPLKFSEKVTTDLEVDSIITSNDNPKSNLGKVKGFLGDQGIGLVRIKDVIEKKQLNVSNYTVTVEKPSWWPIEAPKEISAAKLE